jgi:putative endopeptidase
MTESAVDTVTSGIHSGINTDELDSEVRPQDDLFRHVNGKWLERTEIPADKARWGSFYQLAEEAEKNVRVIIEEAQTAPIGTEARRFGKLYTSFMDTERIEELGAAPLASSLAMVDNVHSIPQLLATVASFERIGVSGFYQFFVDNDPGDPERYLVFFEQAGLSLPDESYYREDAFADIRRKFVTHVQRMFELAGITDAARRAENVFALETELAKHHWDNVKSRDSEKTYNLYRWDDLKGLLASDGADLQVWYDALHAPHGSMREIVLRQPSYSIGLAGLLTPEHLPAWKDWLAWQSIHARAPYLSSDFVNANFDFYGHTLTGTPQLRERWKRAVSFVESGMGEAVGREYVKRHFPEAAKAQMDELVANLIEAYRDSIRALPWMGDDTKKRALEKLSKFTPKIGYPVKWRDYSKLHVASDDLIGNVRAITAFEFNRELSKVGKPIDRDEWFMTPQTINAYYNPGFNEIVFPAAILQFPFFDPERDAAANYGAIGAVIGHEIGHGFDDQGSKFDGDGRLQSWWTDADRAAFEKLTGALIEQYNALTPAQLAGTENAPHVNGALTIGENIGDLGGLGIAWKAYVRSLHGAEAPVIDGLTGAQRFFLSWAQAWQQKGRDAEVLRLMTIDPHSPNEFRCNQIVRNIDEFYAAFNVQPGDALYLPKADRVTIW